MASANLASAVAVLCIPLYGLTRRIRVEEAVLLEVFGTEYEQFAEGRYRLIPGIW